MPHEPAESLPRLLSRTGAFTDTSTLTPSSALIPYDIVVPFWSDGAEKSRWIDIPAQGIGFTRTGEWQFPPGTVLIKHFDLPVDDRDPTILRRLETRLLVIGENGDVYGAVYHWREDASDAELLESSLTEEIPVRTADGGTRWQTWYYPSREDCLECHTDAAGYVLGVKTRQMNRPVTYAETGVTDNQLRAWNHVGLFDTDIGDTRTSALPSLAPLTDTSRSLEDRARSYLDANCSQCHRPGGVASHFDARFDTPLDDQGIVDGRVIIDEGIDGARVISPHDIWRSIAYMRVSTNDDIRMPPLARMTIDDAGVGLLRDWIQSMPGPDVLAPPSITPDGGNYTAPLTVSLAADDADAVIHYTLDGSVPGESDPIYTGPLELSEPTVLRARAYLDGYSRSITAQQVFIVTE